MNGVKVNGVWGLLDKDCNYIKKPSLSVDGYEMFSEGFCAIWVDGNVGFINNKGEVTIPPQFYGLDQEVKGFSEGLAVILMNNTEDFSDDLYGYINTKGELVIKPSFQIARSFSEGLAN